MHYDRDIGERRRDGGAVVDVGLHGLHAGHRRPVQRAQPVAGGEGGPQQTADKTAQPGNENAFHLSRG